MAGERKFVIENVRRHLLKEYVKETISGAGFGGLDIQRTPLGTRVSLLVERPGLVIGRRGSAIKMLTKDVSEKFGFENPQIEVQEDKRPALNAQIMAEKLASALERGWKFRRAGHSTVRRIMEAGAKGCQVTISGKLTGQRHRTAKFKQGHIKFCGEPSVTFMDRGYAVAKLKPGVLGVTVWIMRPDARLPDEIDVLSEVPPEEGEEAPPAEGPPDEVVEEVVEELLEEAGKEASQPEQEESETPSRDAVTEEAAGETVEAEPAEAEPAEPSPSAEEKGE
ncbi:MAG: 30S ribosomal protein S3, partial [Thermoplasmata archaeon]|nr:30S ribosomal protein S3 [Thermoplasmata archaeon]